ncbi:MAG: hypothetical protein MUE36_06155 [Acidimicrobiales bacterium]|jgi:hypothetical protein|nr:hypothetical protein [Acidimicrobiales bacterium]
MTNVELTVLTPEGTVTVPAVVDDDRVLLTADAVHTAIGWEPKPEGLCRGDVCVPVRDPAARDTEGRYDLARVAAALRRPFVADHLDGEAAAVAAVGEAAHERATALAEGRAPRLELTGLDGGRVAIPGEDRRKRLLLAWSSW